MAEKTVRVKVEGKKDVENLSKAVSNLKKTVLSTLADMSKLGGSKNSPIFSVRVQVNRASLAKEIQFVQNQLNSLKLNVKVDSSLSKAIAKSKESISKAQNVNVEVKSNANSEVGKIAKSLNELKSNASSVGSSLSSRINNFANEANNATQVINKVDNAYSKLRQSLDNKIKIKGIDSSALDEAKQILNYVERLNNPNKSKTRVSPAEFSNQTFVPKTPSGQFVSFSRDSLKTMYDHISANKALTQSEKDFLQAQLNVERENEHGIKTFTDYINALDGVKDALDSARHAVVEFISKTTELGAINPAKLLLNGFKEVNQEIISMNTNLAKVIGSNAISNIKSVLGTLSGTIKNEFSKLTEETVKLGDATSIFQLDLESLGKDPKEINKIKKQLGDYGKNTVYDTSDLLKAYSTLTAYGRNDQLDLVKSIGGLTAQTDKPIDNYKEVVAQLSDILSAGKLSQADFRVLRNRLNALGSAELNTRLEQLVKNKGYDTIRDATQNGDLSSEEFLDILKEVGGQEKFQNRANSIVTPRQALDNLRETLSLNFNYEKFDDDGNKIADAPLHKLYTDTKDFINGIKGIVDTDRFTNYVVNTSNLLTDAFDGLFKYAKDFKQKFAGNFLSTLDSFGSDFKKGIKDFNLTDELNDLIENVRLSFEGTGKDLGVFAKDYIKLLTTFTSSLVSVGNELVKGGFLDGVNQVVRLYNNIADISARSGVVKLFAEQFDTFFKTINNIIEQPKIVTDLSILTKSISDYLSILFKGIETLGTKTNIIPNIIGSINDTFKFFTTLLNDIEKQVSTNDINKVVSNIRVTFQSLLKGLEPIYANLISSTIKFGASDSGKKLFQAISDFVVSITKSVETALVSLGNGSVEKGLETISGYVESFIKAISKISKFIGANFNLVVGGLIVTKVFSSILGVIKAYNSFISTMSEFGNSYLGSKVVGLGKSAINKTKSSLGIDDDLIKAKVNYAKDRVKNVFKKTPEEPSISISKGTQSIPKVKVPSNSKQIVEYTTALSNSAEEVGAVAVGGKLAKATGVLKSMPAIVKGIALSGLGDLGVQTVNSVVQNSKASDGVKQASQGVSTVASFASAGALAGSVIPLPGLSTGVGALVGGVIGVGKALYDQINNERDKVNAEKEKAKQSNNQAWDSLISSLSQTSNATASFFNSQALQQTKLQQDLAGLNSALQNTFATLGKGGDLGVDGIKASLQSLGYNYKIPVDNINDLYVKVGNDIIKWSALKEQQGVKDDETLLASLNASSVALGTYQTTLVDSNGNIVATINAFTESQQQARESKKQEIVDSLTKLGLSKQELESKTLEDLTNFKNGLEEVLNTPFKTDEEQANALKDFILKFNPSADVANKSLKQLLKMSEDIEKTLHDNSEEGIEEQREELLTKLKELGVNVKGKAKEYAHKSLESLQREVNELQYTGGEEGADDLIPYLQEAFKGNEKVLKGKSKEQIQKLVEFYNQAIQAYGTGNTALGDDAVQSVMTLLGTNDETLRTKLIEQLTKAGEKLKQGSDSVHPEQVAGIDTSPIGIGAESLKTNTKGSIDKSAGKLKEGASKADKDFSGISTDPIAVGVQTLWDNINLFIQQAGDALNNAVSSITGGGTKKSSKRKSKHHFDGGLVTAYRQLGGIIPEYHAQGGLGGIQWTPRGTDTVPAMLTPGEFVIRKQAVDSLGEGFLNRLNRQGNKTLSNNSNTTIINNVYNNNNAQVSQNIDNKSGYINAMSELDRLMRYV